MTRYTAVAVLAIAGAVAASLAAAAPAAQSAALTERPLVMRLSKDEFRIAFGLNAVGCLRSGCHGVIRYRVAWRADDGTQRTELRAVSYSVLPHYERALTVDRQYFDSAEGAHETTIEKVAVGSISCVTGLQEPRRLTANLH
jgi:hypothetical protein